MFIAELFEPGKNWNWLRRTGEEARAQFQVGDREYIWDAFVHGHRYGAANKKKWEIQFRLVRDYDNDPGDLDLFGTTGTGNSAEVISTAVDITRAFLQHYGLDKVEEITFNAKEDSRIGLYAKMIKRLLPNWDLYSKKDPQDGMVFTLTDRRAYDKPENKMSEDMSRRGFLGALGAGAMAASGMAQAKSSPVAQPVANNPKVELLMKWAKKFITNPAELAAFMAQCAHESDNFKTMTEYGSPERFAQKYDIQHNPAKAKQLGNTQPGDGVKYKGRGYIQLTGKYNYQKAGEWISKYIGHPVDFVAQPELVATPTAAALSSIWYWMNFVHGKTKGFANTKQVTKHINPGLRGQANREQKARDWQAALNVKPIKPGKPIKVASR